MNWIKDPGHRVAAAKVLFFLSLIGWAGTHLLMWRLDPPENSWVFHVLLAISWFAITITCVDVIATTDVRKQHEEEDE